MNNQNKINVITHSDFKIKSLKTSDIVGLRRALTNELDSRRPHQKSNYPLCLRSYGNNLEDYEVERSKVYNDLIADDWSYLFNGNDDGNNDYYVYYHTDPGLSIRTRISGANIQLPIYIGMGRGERMYNFKRSVQHTELLSYFLDNGYGKGDICGIISSGLTKSIAMELESKLILFWGCSSPTFQNALSGYHPCLFNNRYEPYPEKYNDIGCACGVFKSFKGAK